MKFIPDNSRRSNWLCICDCGKELIVPGKLIRNGHKTNCGCKFIAVKPGDVFGRLTVVEMLDSMDVLCDCECGNEHITKKYSLVNGKTSSCGCYSKQRAGEM